MTGLELFLVAMTLILLTMVAGFSIAINVNEKEAGQAVAFAFLTILGVLETIIIIYHMYTCPLIIK